MQGIELRLSNPNTLTALGHTLYVAGSAVFGDRKGGIERIDLSGDGAAQVVFTEEVLAGDITNLALVSARRAYAIVLNENIANTILPLNLEAGEVGEPLKGHSGGFTPDLVTDGVWLIVADQGTFDRPDLAGLLVYDAATSIKLEGPISVGLPPSSLAILDPAPQLTAVFEESDPALPSHATLGAAWPNPFNATTRIPFELATSAEVMISIYDLLGQKVRTLVAGSMPVGFYTVDWDGLNDRGETVGNSSYIVEMRHRSFAITKKSNKIRINCLYTYS